ncbi:uncharacterized protein PGTG_13428 [Puccinia graminis f. sp. tritici CRL 75-36-700-3]|uniref:Uncharacterized protein n=1 Tax=Puccinia graminis f. sp. tritici (strain CRL 75-36-700-3 / race SCCL) TaxID=418459 RepID=E3KTS1_PUCGT|nr:uncharacterized protein PGTG_13428 [Puccinia graminis f. sp. tritici CRL 75-36-700-3]EFP87642.2 hypothetical protein PGTG_13428 [Puccinia graminis f. sp. tritici CRL 75-36-700-3]
MAHSYAPLISSPLANSGPRPPAGIIFGAAACTPKTCIFINLSEARNSPHYTSSASHQYRFTQNGIALFAVNGTNFHIKPISEDDEDDDDTF